MQSSVQPSLFRTFPLSLLLSSLFVVALLGASQAAHADDAADAGTLATVPGATDLDDHRTANLSSTPLASAATLWFEDWEGNWTDNWFADAGTWEVGTPTSGPSECFGSDNCAATVLAGNYADGVDTRLIRIDPFTVPAASENPHLRFQHWYSFGGGDVGHVLIKTPEQSWEEAAIIETYGGGFHTYSLVWTHAFLELNDYAGQTVQLAFFLQTRDTCTPACVNPGPGWYIDDVAVLTGPITFNNPEDFESGFDDWYADFGTWEVGTATSGPGSCFGGSGCAATNLAGNYGDNIDSRLISPAFTVPATSENPHLRFQHWYSFGGGDAGAVQIKSEEGEWTTILGPYTGSGGGVWTRPFYDLNSYAGQTVQLAFFLQTRDTCTPACVNPGLGWYIDDVLIQGLDGSPPDITVSPGRHSYREVELGSSTTQIFTISNTGGEILEVDASDIIGSDAGAFNIESGGAPFSLTASESRDLVLGFSPSSLGEKNAVLRIESNDPDEDPFDVPVIGCGAETRSWSRPVSWSLASLPLDPCTGTTLDDIFESFISAFIYDPASGYVSTDDPDAPAGFWLNLGGAESIVHLGQPVGPYVRELPAGWSLIGGLTEGPAEVITDPAGALQALFRYEPGEGYQETGQIAVGEGAWINCGADCEVSVTPAAFKRGAPPVAAAGAVATITATGAAVQGHARRSQVILGLEEPAHSVPAPPAAPAYTTQVLLFTPGEMRTALYRDIRRGRGMLEHWVLKVEPNGNTSASGSTTLTWEASALRAIADVPWTLRQGRNGAGEVIIQDMRQTSTLTLSGTDAQFFTIAARLPSTGAEDKALPEAFALRENYPNPFNPQTTIRYEVPTSGQMSIRVFNVLGQHVHTLLDGPVEAGRHTVTWDARDQTGSQVPSGVYFCRMEAARFVQTQSMILMK